MFVRLVVYFTILTESFNSWNSFGQCDGKCDWLYIGSRGKREVRNDVNRHDASRGMTVPWLRHLTFTVGSSARCVRSFAGQKLTNDLQESQKNIFTTFMFLISDYTWSDCSTSAMISRKVSIEEIEEGLGWIHTVTYLQGNVTYDRHTVIRGNRHV